MADTKKPAGSDDIDTELDDKSINELLKEYADDVKDKDLDEFLHDAPGEDDDDDAFESDDALMEDAAPQKKSGGFLGLFLVLLLCGAAGAGVWMYLNRDDGMTNVMGGFKGEPVPADEYAATPVINEPLVPESAPVLPPLASDAGSSSLGNVLADDLPPPMPISNEETTALAPIAPEPLTPDTPDTATAATTPAAPAVETPAVAAPATPSDTAPVARMPEISATTPAQSPDAASAVSAWVAGADDTMADVEEKLPTVGQTLPEQPVAEVKAKPVTINAAQKAQPVKTDSAASTAAPARTSSSSAADDALPPPYMAIQARKAGAANTDAPAATTPSATAPRVATPVVDDDGIVYRRGSTAHTEPAQTRATGIYRDLVNQGGGAIELGTTTIYPDAAAATPVTPLAPTRQDAGYADARNYNVPAQNPAPSSGLAIQGGRSLPPGVTVRPAPNVSVTAQLPAGVPNAPVAMPPASETAYGVPRIEAPSQVPVARNEVDTTAAGTATGLLRDAQQAEAEGRFANAVELYQRALEADAIYGDGRSIDRGMVYDRIGAIRARQ